MVALAVKLSGLTTVVCCGCGCVALSPAPLVGATGAGDSAVGMHVVSHAALPDGRWLRASDAWATHERYL